MGETIFNEIDNCAEAGELFDLTSEYFQGQGFGGICYAAPAGAAGPYVLMERGMSPEWIARYRAQELNRFDPLPGIAFRLGNPIRIDEALARLPSLNADEQCYIEAFKSSGIVNGLLVPTYGPFGRPALIGLTAPAHPRLLDEFNVPLAAAVAQQVHVRMEHLQIEETPPDLSPREREVLGWLGQGKSAADIATILGAAVPTVTTHIQRIYAKLQVHDRVSCITKARAHHYL